MNRFAVVICGGVIAGVEALLRLRRLAGEAVAVTLLGVADDLIYRPLRVFEPFTGAAAARYPIADIAAHTGARWVRDRLAWVDRATRIVHTAGGQALRYDALLLAIGGSERKPDANVAVFTDHTSEHIEE